MTTRAERQLELAAFVLHIQGAAVERDGCWIWKGATVKGQGVTPVVRWAGKTVAVRLQMHRLKLGDVPEGKRATYTCENPLCVHPNHVGAFTMSELRLRDAEKRNYLDPVFRTKAQKARLRIPDETVAAIRESDEPIRPLAARLGVSKYSIWAIRNNLVRRDFMSVTAGLGGRARNKQEGVRK